MRLGNVGQTVDEYEWWPADLSSNPELLCQNGWDGEWHSRTGMCSFANQ
jgi:hypothetical protein